MFKNVSSKVFQAIAITFMILSASCLIIRLSNFYPDLNSELKSSGMALVGLGFGFIAVARRRKSKEMGNK